MGKSNKQNAPPAVGIQLSKHADGMDAILYCEDGDTFFEGRLYCSHHFGFETLRKGPDNGLSRFGANLDFTAPPTGDAIQYMYACVYLPGIKGCATEDSGSSGCTGGASEAFPNTKGKAACTEEDEKLANAAGGKDKLFAKLGHCTSQYLEFGGYLQGELSEDLDALEDALLAASGGDSGVAEALDADGDGQLDDVGADDHLPPTQWPNAAYWVDGVAFQLIQTATLNIGHNEIAELYSKFLFMWEQVAGKAGLEQDRLVGLGESIDDQILDSMNSKWYYVQLPFWFSLDAGHVLRLMALMFASVTVNIQLASLESCVCVIGDDTKVEVCGNGKGAGREVSEDDITVELATTHIWMEDATRMRLASYDQQIITQVKSYPMTLTQQDNKLDPKLGHATIEMFFAAQRRCAEQQNDHFNFSGPFGVEIIKNFSMSVNDVHRVYQTEASWFRKVTPTIYNHSRRPTAMVYCYSFAIFPEEFVVSGSLNMSRFEHMEIRVELHEGMLETGESIVLHLFTRVWNLMRLKRGTAYAHFQ